MNPHARPPTTPALEPDPKAAPDRTSRRAFVRHGLQAGLGLALLPAAAACSNDADTGTGPGTSSPAPTKPAPPSTASTSATSPTKVSLGPLEPGVHYPAGYVGPRAHRREPFTTTDEVFTVVVPEDTSVVGDWNKSKCTAWFERYTGLKVKFQTVSTANNDMTKVNAMIASGDLPDAFMGIPFTRDQVSLYGSQGVFTRIDDLLGRYAPQLQEAIADYPDLALLAKSVDGHTYAFPGLNDCYHCHASTGRCLVNTKMIDAGGGKVPTTTDEFAAFLRALKRNDATGHGDVVPLAAGVDNPLDTYFMNSFLYNPGEPWLRVADGQVQFVADKRQWRDALKFLRRLYDDGTLSPQVFTMTSDALQKLGNNPGHARLAVVRAYYWGSFMDIDLVHKDARWRDYEAMAPLKGPEGTRYSYWDHYSAYQPTQLVITRNCSKPELLVQWADYQMGLEGIMHSNKGVQKTNWHWAPKGATAIDGKQAVFGVKGMPAPVGQSWNQYSPMYRSNDQRLSQSVDPRNPTFEQPLYQDTKRAYEPYQPTKDWQLPPLIFDESAAATNADVALALANHVNQSMAQFATGKLDVHDDAVWKTYTDKMAKMGMGSYLHNYQAAYDAQVKG